jgi:error-prone DNA polymerase
MHNNFNDINPQAVFSELWSISNFSFLRGASHPEELVAQAAQLKYKAISIADYSSLAGVVRAHRASKQYEIPLVIGVTLLVRCSDNHPPRTLVIHPTSRTGYGLISKLLSSLPYHQSSSPPSIAFHTAKHFLNECFITIVPPDFDAYEPESSRKTFHYDLETILESELDARQFSLAYIRHASSTNYRREEYTIKTSIQYSIPLLATNACIYHSQARAPLQDILTCIRNHTTIQEAGIILHKNDCRHLQSLSEIARLYQSQHESIDRGNFISNICSQFSLSNLSYSYPREATATESTAHEKLIRETWHGAHARYGECIPDKVQQLLTEELRLIKELEYEHYFLTCYDIVQFARSQGILCQGRGAAANSAVCFCLGITSVNPIEIDTLFARFISKERLEPPDIDIDFEHQRREEVIQYIYKKYGRDHAALTAEVVTYQEKSALRDVAKALGLPLDVINALTQSVHRWNNSQLSDSDLIALNLNPADVTIKNVISFSKMLCSFPRHLSQHVGGFIISHDPLNEIVPIRACRMSGRTMIEWDKDDIEELGILKIDILGLGMLSCIQRAFSLINADSHCSATVRKPLSLSSVPREDPQVYEMICDADTIGVFQIESRAQISMLPRLKPRCFYDLVIEVAIVRPGPIQGDMVHPYLRRRSGVERVSYPDHRVEAILGKTLGVPLFQEQAMRLAIVLAQFSPGEAEQLRRAMAAWKHNKEIIATFTERIVRGMMNNGYTREFAFHCTEQIKGFSEYGFPESHAASFALLVYVSAWLKRHFPVHFAAALLNSMPLGFYAPAQIIRDVEAPLHEKRRAYRVLPIDLLKSSWESTVEHHGVENQVKLRLGLSLVKGLQKRVAEDLINIIKTAPRITQLSELWSKIQNRGLKVSKSQLQLLAKAGALDGICPQGRRVALWKINELHEQSLPLIDEAQHDMPNVPALCDRGTMQLDYLHTGMSLEHHPLRFLRTRLKSDGYLTSVELRSLPLEYRKKEVRHAGMVIVRQRPSTAHGMVFLTLEDETGISNIMIRPHIYERYRHCILQSQIIAVCGRYERIGKVVYVHTDIVQGIEISSEDKIPL